MGAIVPASCHKWAQMILTSRVMGAIASGFPSTIRLPVLYSFFSRTGTLGVQIGLSPCFMLDCIALEPAWMLVSDVGTYYSPEEWASVKDAESLSGAITPAYVESWFHYEGLRRVPDRHLYYLDPAGSAAPAMLAPAPAGAPATEPAAVAVFQVGTAGEWDHGSPPCGPPPCGSPPCGSL